MPLEISKKPKVSPEARERGERIKIARSFAGHTKMTQLAKAHPSLPINTLKLWESGHNKLTEDGAKRIISALNEDGVSVSIAWLLTGTGPGPMRQYEDASTIQPSSSEQRTSFQQIINNRSIDLMQEVSQFMRQFADAVCIQINDSEMEPELFIGDYACGVWVSGEELNVIGNTICIIEDTQGRSFCRRIYEQTGKLYTLETANSDNVYEVNKVAVILKILSGKNRMLA